MAEPTRTDRRPTRDDIVLPDLRRDGSLGPFRVVDWAAASRAGHLRPQNEDRWGVVDDRLFAVADGMGGRPGGALAATTAVDAVTEFGVGMTEASAPELADRISCTVAGVTRAEGYTGAGTTLVAVAIHPHHVVVLGVGDSRVYRWRRGELRQLTRDHTFASELEMSGVAAASERFAAADLQGLTSHIGKRSTAGIMSSSGSFSIVVGDRFVLCTDGVHAEIGEVEIATALGAMTCADAVCRLVQRSTSVDDATAVVVEFGTEGAADG